MESKKYFLNDEFDIRLFIYILKKNAIVLLVFLLVLFIATFLYLRYTQPEFESYAIIQIKTDDKASKIFETQSTPYIDNTLSKKIEIIRSPMFMKRVVKNLPLDLTIYSIGEIGKYEFYNNAPIKIFYEITDTTKFSKTLYLLVKKTSIEIEDPFHNINREIPINEPLILPGIVLSVHSSENLDSLTFFQNYAGSKFMLKFMLTEELAIHYSNKIQIQVLNEQAKTLKISIRETNPTKAFDIIRKVVEEYDRYDVESQQQSAQSILEFIDNQLEKVDSTLAIFLNQGVSPTDTIFDWETINKNIQETEDRINQIQKEILFLNKLIQKMDEHASIVDMYSIVSGTQSYSTLSSFFHTLQQLEMKKNDALQGLTPESPNIIHLNQQIEFQRQLIKKMAEGLKQNYNSELNILKHKKQIWENKGMMKGKSSSAQGLRSKKLYYTNEQIFDQLIQKKVEYSIALAGYVSQVVVLRPPLIYKNPVKPRKNYLWFISFFTYLVLSLFYLGMRYLFYNKIISPSDIKNLSNIPVIGVVPRYHHFVPASQLIVDSRPNSVIAESLRAIRTQFQFISNKEGAKVIAITSTISGEGKTFIAINLAGVIAFSESKVLVVDFDLRRPRIHIGLGALNDKGVTTILTGQASVEECIKQSSIPNLHFITAGKPLLFPSELIMSSKMDEFVNFLKTKYDFIIFDTPPIGLISDALKPLMIADYPIYIMRAHYSYKSFLLNAQKLFQENQIKNITIIINNINPKLSGASKYEGYVYGYAYGYGYVRHSYYHEEEPLIPWYKRIFKRKNPV
ncbi:MAG: polysaccharide biosynthesis tyrosine autokinase [Bacteroidales bacterium]|nr:polysaccharide biosynthesis tyrosine autokinase [Bacteroidales bacterium]